MFSTHNIVIGHRGRQIWLQMELQLVKENSVLGIGPNGVLEKWETINISDVIRWSTDNLNTILLIERSDDFFVVFNSEKFHSVAKSDILGYRMEGELRLHWATEAAPLSLFWEAFDFGI